MAQYIYELCSCGSGKKFKFCCYQKRSAIEGVSDSNLIKRAAEFPVYEVWINNDWRDEGMAQIVVARQLPNLRYMLGVYLVDTFGLGLKDTFHRPQLKYEDLEDLLGRFPAELEEAEYEDARSIVLGAIEYARKLGFEPQRDFKRTSTIIEGERDFERKFTFGNDGVPFYVQGPNDDSSKIVDKLKPLIKAGKAHFVTEADQFPSMRANDFEDQCDEVSGLLERRRFSDARRVIERLIKSNPKRSEPQFLMGTCLAMEGEMAKAIPFLERASEMNPSAETYYNLAGAYRPLLKLNEAMASLKKVVELDSKNGQYGKRAQHAITELTQVIKAHTGLSVEEYMANKVRFDEAYKHLTAGIFDLAIDGFNGVLAVEPNHVQSHGNLGLAYLGIGNRDAAIKHFDRAIELDPSYQPAIDNRKVAMELEPGELLNARGSYEVEFYADRAKAAKEEDVDRDTLVSPIPVAVKPSVGQRIKDLFWR
jgi:tetratricopeptide (TPR) repeat protein